MASRAAGLGTGFPEKLVFAKTGILSGILCPDPTLSRWATTFTHLTRSSRSVRGESQQAGQNLEIPAKAGTQHAAASAIGEKGLGLLDPRLRGDDDRGRGDV
jgi:hypothetical protein